MSKEVGTRTNTDRLKTMVSGRLYKVVRRTVRITGPNLDMRCKARIQQKVLTTTWGTFYLATKKWIVDDKVSFEYEDNTD